MAAPQTDPPKLNHIAPGWFLEYMDKLRQWLIDNRPVAGLNVALTDADGGGKRINADIGASLATASSHPFKILLSSTKAGKTKFTVYKDSWLMRSFRVSDYKDITGLGEEFELGDGDSVWLEITFDENEEMSAAEIKWGDFGGDDSPVKFLASTGSQPNKKQTKAYHIIGYAREDDGMYPDRIKFGKTKLEIVQCCRTNLVLCQTCFETDTVMLPFPYSGPGPKF